MTKKRDRVEAADKQNAKKEKKSGRAKAPKGKSVFLEYAKAIGSAILIALILRQFLFQAFRIPSGSMLETLQIGDFLFVNKFLYGAQTPTRIKLFNLTVIDNIPHFRLPAVREPRQGDIIVFEYPQDRNLDYIKRCVAVAGDTVAVKDGILYVNSDIYESNFADRDGDHSCIPSWTDPESCPKPSAKHDQSAYTSKPRTHTFPWPGMANPYIVPTGHIFMMGDNRYNSADSRYWGPLDTDLIKGKAMFIYWSWNSKKHLPRINRMGDLIR